MSNQNTDRIDWFWLVVALLVAVSAALYYLWGNEPKFSDTMSVIDKHWERKVMLEHRECDEDGCSWVTTKTARLEGKKYPPLRWPEIREPKRLERLEKEETYFIDFLARDGKTYTRQTHDSTEYQSSKMSSVHSVVINNFGNVREILPETINN